MVCMTRDSQRTALPVISDSWEPSPMKTLTAKRAGGLERSLWVASYLVPPNPQLSVCLKKNTAIYYLILTVGGFYLTT